MAAFNQVLYMTSLVNSLHHLVVQGGAGWLNLNFTWCLFNVLVINYTKSSKKKKRKEERCHGRLYLTSGVPQEVTYMRNNFIESQALGSISVRQTDQSNEQREKNEETACSSRTSEGGKLTCSAWRWDKGTLLLWSGCFYAWSLPAFGPTRTAKIHNIMYTMKQDFFKLLTTRGQQLWLQKNHLFIEESTGRLPWPQ